METTDIRNLVLEALQSLPKPYTEHVIEDVFRAIESKPRWLTEYEGLCMKHTRTVANALGGYWIGRELGKRGKRQVQSKKCSLIGSYSILDTDALPPPSKPKEPQALKMMSDYFYANQSRLPPIAKMKTHRHALLQLLMDGVSPDEAYAIVLRDDA